MITKELHEKIEEFISLQLGSITVEPEMVSAIAALILAIKA